MNVQERDQLLQFFSSLQHARAQPKDPVAEELIRQALADGLSPYDLVQRAMGLGLALQASQARVAELEARCQAMAASQAQAGASSSTLPSGAPAPEAASGLWSQGLLRHAAGTAVGVAAGMAAGSALLSAWQAFAEGPPPAGAGLADAAPGLWELGDDWT